MSCWLLRLGSVVALATCTAAGSYDWWVGRVEKMKRKSGRNNKLVRTTDAVLFDEARTTQMEVIKCTRYRKHSRYIFTYNVPIDDQSYSLEHAQGLVASSFQPVRASNTLRDPLQGVQLGRCTQAD